MSPEQASGEPVDARSDLFALGTMLHEMVMGQRLHQGDSLPAIAMALILVDERMASQDLLGPVDQFVPGLAPIVGKCVRRQPDERYATAAEVAKELRALLKTVPEVPMVEFLEACGVGQEEDQPAIVDRETLPPPPVVGATRRVPVSRPAEPVPAPPVNTQTLDQRRSAAPPDDEDDDSGGRGLLIGVGALGVLAILALIAAFATFTFNLGPGSIPEEVPEVPPTEVASDEPTPEPRRPEPTPEPRRPEPTPRAVEPEPTPAAVAEPEPEPEEPPTEANLLGPLAEGQSLEGLLEAAPEPTPEPEPAAPSLHITFDDAERVGKRAGKTVVAFVAVAECPASCSLKV
ncbi:MAG: hypothetical protein GY898_05035 [Proteobacteria bacterium]|nr:hypothetical protein [Pseudomonadota bacterium]